MSETTTANLPVSVEISTPQQEVSQFSRLGVKFTATGLEFHNPDLAEKDWADLGIFLLRRDQVMQWYVGDWAAFGAGDERQQGWRKKGALKTFCEVNGFSYQNVLNKCYVSSNVMPQLRRADLPWCMYAEVAPLKPKDQISWIKKASKEGLSVSNLRLQIRRSSASEPGFESDGPQIRLASKLADDLVAWLRRQSSEFWTPQAKSAWRRILEPLVRFYDGLA